MKKWLLLIAVPLVSIVAFVLAGIGLAADEPPLPSVTVDGTAAAVFRGSYCWSGPASGKCVDMTSPPDIIRFHGAAPVTASPEATIDIRFKKKPVSGTFGATIWLENGETRPARLDGEALVAPGEPGIYVYDIHAVWEEGSASFVFAIEVR